MLGFRFLNLGRWWWWWWYDQDQGTRVQITFISHNIITDINIVNSRLLQASLVITRKTLLIVVIIDENVFGDLEDVIADIAPAVVWPVRAKILLKLTDILTGRHKIVTSAPAISESCSCSTVASSQTWEDPLRVCAPFQEIWGDGETKQTFSPFFLFSCWTLYWHAVTDWVNWISYSQYFVGSHGTELSAGIERQSDHCNIASRVSCSALCSVPDGQVSYDFNCSYPAHQFLSTRNIVGSVPIPEPVVDNV